MKLIAFATMTVAFLATTATARFGMGACPGADTPRVAFDDITTDLPFQHYIQYVDPGMLDLIDGLESIGFKPIGDLDYGCDQLGSLEPWATQATDQYDTNQKETTPDEVNYDGVNFFYEDEDIFNSIFNDRDDAILSYVFQNDNDEDSQEMYYFCADTTSAPALLEWFGAFGVESTSTGTSLANLLNSVTSIFSKLGLIFKVHGAAIFGPYGDEDNYDDSY